MRAFTSLLFLALAAGVSGLSISTPSNASPGNSIAITWTSDKSDPSTFQANLFDNNDLPFGIKQFFGDVNTAKGQATFTLDKGLETDKTYVIWAANSSSIDQVYAASQPFKLTASGQNNNNQGGGQKCTCPA
ncbi:hypothetical protein V5O48_014046 [Marasmius crinis-equi]|uniref:Yeast cell wall synthesis Kre9/Knh1-like N-terminal domain-containing protein n=1 Tax=Marasmius crinis-equi TaxID=585013 RepID=A0ABR3EYE2_9AGAR